MKLYSVRDAAAALFMQVFTSQTNGTAIRDFASEANEPRSPLYKNPKDYELFEMGEFDNQTGTIVLLAPRSIARAIDYNNGADNETNQKETR